MEEDRRWVSASELAEYAYCPRAHWYREHPPSGARPRWSSIDRAARAGQRYHRRTLGAERFRDDHAIAYALLAILGVGLVVAAVFIGSVA